jgi:hypothetical protein
MNFFLIHFGYDGYPFSPLNTPQLALLKGWFQLALGNTIAPLGVSILNRFLREHSTDEKLRSYADVGNVPRPAQRHCRYI